MYYTIYQTTNKVNQKIYVGAHKTKDLDDTYLGSGKMLNRAIEKHGIESFERKVLFICADEHEMYQKEREIVNEDFVKRSDTYNMKRGGHGGWDHVDNTGRILSEDTHKKMSVSAKIRQTGETNSFYGKRHSKSSLEKIGMASKARAKTQYEQRLVEGNHPNSFGSCPHCGKYGQLRAMKRWHFDKCSSQIFQ
jgi:group I intron endonuclease